MSRRALTLPPALLLGALIATGGCTARSSPGSQAVTAPEAVTSRVGVIASVRPLPPAAAGRGDVRGNILAALGGGLAGGDPAGGSGASEVVVRQDDGATVSVVVPDGDGYRPGERVTLLPGARSRLVRAP
jgi:outer membrane lipoprotein SlyB